MRIAFVFNQKISDSLEEAEFDTQSTIDAISGAIESGGHQVVRIPMTRDERWIEQLRRSEPQLVFNTAEGFTGVGRESFGPVVFEQLGLPYVGSGPYACFLTLDKFLTKQMVSRSGVPVVVGYFVNTLRELVIAADGISYPAFVKPNYEGSSKGITARSLCRTRDDLLNYGKESLKLFPEGLLVEKFIPGRDVSVGFINGVGKDGVLDPIEYVMNSPSTADWIYDYQLKNELDDQVRAVRSNLDPSIQMALRKYVKHSTEVLGVVDMGRADFRITPEGEIFFVEFNALPSLQPGAGIFEVTARLGISYEKTILTIVNSAVSRLKLRGRAGRAPKRTVLKKPRVALVYNLRRKEKHESGFEAEAEFDSPKTIEAIQSALLEIGYDVVPLEATRNLADQLQRNSVQIVFNIAEGIGSRAREAQVPAVCDLLGIEYTGSDATCLSISLDKAVSKRLVEVEGVLTPKSRLFPKTPKVLPKGFDLQFPVIVKPNAEGTSKGISLKSVVENETELVVAVEEVMKKVPGPVLVEEFIQGREFTMAVFGQSILKTLGPLEIRFKDRPGEHSVYSLEAKMCDNAYDNEFLQLICPVSDLPAGVDRAISIAAKKAFRALGCRDVARIDFRMDAQRHVYFLEANPLPGLSPNFSDLTILAEKCGWSYVQLIRTILEPAAQRWRASVRSRH